MRDEHARLRLSLGAYVLGELPEPEADAVERHLVRCAGCAAEADRLTVAVHALTLIAPEEIRRLGGGSPPGVT